MRTRWAYYSRSDSYSRSYNAEQAESEGRFPKSRFRAEIRKAIGSRATPRLLRAYYRAGEAIIERGTSEWHHVGRYASRIDYFDFSELFELAKRLTKATKDARTVTLKATRERTKRYAAAKAELELARACFKSRLERQRDAYKPRRDKCQAHRQERAEAFNNYLSKFPGHQRNRLRDKAADARKRREVRHKKHSLTHKERPLS
jgi:hypothetical protein